MISICKRFEFDAAHTLPFHTGKCKNLHGHRYILDIEVVGSLKEGGPSTGMVMDFSDLKTIVNKFIIDRFDHTYLNESCPVYPTAEKMVDWIVDLLITRFSDFSVTLRRVRLYETPTSYAEWRMG